MEEKRRQRKIHASDVARRTADACGVSRRTVFNAIRQASEEQYPSSSKGEEKRGRPVIALDEFTESAIRMQVRDFFSKKKNATAEKVLAACVANVRDFPAMSIEVKLLASDAQARFSVQATTKQAPALREASNPSEQGELFTADEGAPSTTEDRSFTWMKPGAISTTLSHAYGLMIRAHPTMFHPAREGE